MQSIKHDAKELAYIYDLYVAPMWREIFDRMVDEEIEFPKEGKFLDALCGTGGYAVDLSLRLGAKVAVVGIDPSEEKLILARGKADIKKPNRTEFHASSLKNLSFPVGEFDLVVGDFSMLPVAEIEDALDELVRVTKKGGTIVLKLATQGSFGEFFSIYWEALYDLDLVGHSPEVERLISEPLTVGNAETMALDAGLSKVRSVAKNERLDFSNGDEFFGSPLIASSFLDGWMAFLPDSETRGQVQQQLGKIIDRERQGASFDVSVKAALIVGQK
ncbi:MAG: methyltransferase domain-containing protein [Acidobacteriota bacterium]|nr:methyltransferase domain-containing protein [Acidobacteriota bacterium]